MQDDRVYAGLNATLDTASVMFKILFAVFVPGLAMPVNLKSHIILVIRLPI
jgi:hypothetical protein